MPILDPSVPASEWHLGDPGRASCERLAAKLRQYSPDLIIASRESKATETGRIVASRLSKQFENGEGLHEHERDNEQVMCKAIFEARIKEFFSEPDKVIFGSESADQAHERFSRAVDAVIKKHPLENIAIIAHGTVISLYVSRISLQDPFGFWNRLGLPSFVVVSYPEMMIEKVVENV